MTIKKSKHFFEGGCGGQKTVIPFIETFEEDVFNDCGETVGTFKTIGMDFWIKWLDDGRGFAGGKHFQFISPLGVWEKT